MYALKISPNLNLTPVAASSIRDDQLCPCRVLLFRITILMFCVEKVSSFTFGKSF